jgi:hypothetical protein
MATSVSPGIVVVLVALPSAVVVGAWDARGEFVSSFPQAPVARATAMVTMRIEVRCMPM